MKKLILLSAFALFLGLEVSAQATAPRFGTTKSADNTGRVLTYGYLQPAYAAIVTVTPSKYENVYAVGTLTGAITVNTSTTTSKVCDKMTLILAANSTSRVVTFSNNIVATGTMGVLASKQATIRFIFDGVNWIELGRWTQP